MYFQTINSFYIPIDFFTGYLIILFFKNKYTLIKKQSNFGALLCNPSVSRYLRHLLLRHRFQWFLLCFLCAGGPRFLIYQRNYTYTKIYGKKRIVRYLIKRTLVTLI